MLCAAGRHSRSRSLTRYFWSGAYGKRFFWRPAPLDFKFEVGTCLHEALRLAYLTTEYPKVSHTFIRREIAELERRGLPILRLAIRSPGGAIADPADIAEAARTTHCLELPRREFARRSLEVFARNPLLWARATEMAVAMSRRSERGLARHAAYLAEAAVLLRRLEQERIDHVHVHFGTNAAAVARLMRCLGGPTYSVTIHGPDEFDAPIGFSLGAKVEDAAFVCAISDYASAQLRRWVGPAHWDKIHVVHCTVGDAFLNTQHIVDPDSKLLVSVGRLSAQKGQLLLVDALDQALRAGVDARLVLVGDGELRGVIEERIRLLGLVDRIEITGWVDEATIREYIRRSRALVLPSFAEGLPVVIMEAMAMGRPVVSTMIAGIPELVKPGENGWLVTSGRVDEVAGAICEVMKVPADMLDNMGKRGRDRVRRYHHTETEVGKLEALFRQYVHAQLG
ncbi:MAG: glycosyltransferase family 4 protein [Deltaproteobacteria bacterium]|nr:glycosyltransferase family 4 protein [Deltaproteobacteria bacterium]